MIFLSACETISSNKSLQSPCPQHPVAGEKVAQELEALDPEKFPNFIEWMGRIDKHKDQLETTL